MKIPYGPIATKEGLRLNGVNFAPWEQLGNARPFYFLGLPHILLTRDRGLFRTWWVHLYLVDWEAFRTSVETCAPEGHSFRQEVLRHPGPPRYAKLRFLAVVILIAGALHLISGGLRDFGRGTNDCQGMCRLTVESDPKGASIFVDGRNTGKITPSTINVPAKKRFRLRLNLEGYLDFVGNYQVTKNDQKIPLTLQKELAKFSD